MSEIKIYRVNDYEWWAGSDLDSIKAAYEEHTGIDPDSDEGFDAPREVGDAGMDKLIFFDDGPEPTQCTFRERLNELITLQSAFP